jgi:hypothetical protein
MTIRIAASWQTLFADLSIILFMITAATLSRSSGEEVLKLHPAAAEPTPAASPIALYRAGEGSPPLAQWLAAQAPDARQRLSILVTYRRGGQSVALERAAAMLRQSGTAGAEARVVIEPGTREDATASLTFDAALAQSLPHAPGKQETMP